MAAVQVAATAAVATVVVVVDALAAEAATVVDAPVDPAAHLAVNLPQPDCQGLGATSFTRSALSPRQV